MSKIGTLYQEAEALVLSQWDMPDQELIHLVAESFNMSEIQATSLVNTIIAREVEMEPVLDEEYYDEYH